MDVVLALEGVRVLLFVVDTLHLDRGVVKLVLSAAEVSDLGECLQRLDRLDMASHGDFAH